MRKNVFYLIAASVVVSCGLSEIGEESPVGNEVWTGPGSAVVEEGNSTGVGRKVWYAVGVDYQDGYDWRTDNQRGSVKCSLVVFANNVPLMKVPVGDEYETSADPDMHRIVDGHLYTDYSSETQTVLKKDGVELLRYDERELILDMVVEGDTVYTLGQFRNGGGFAFRKNGHPLVKRTSGYAFPGLIKCNDGLRFAFCEVIEDVKETHERYFLSDGENVMQIGVRDDIKKIWDITFFNGNICYLASLVGISAPVLSIGEQMSALHMSPSTEILSCHFAECEDELIIEGVVSQRSEAIFSNIWRQDRLVTAFPHGFTVSSLCASDGGVSCVLNKSSNMRNGLIYRCGELLPMPSGYVSMGEGTAVMVDGMLHVGLTPEKSGEPAIWVDGEMKPVHINGFISHLAVD